MFFQFLASCFFINEFQRQHSNMEFIQLFNYFIT